MSDKLLRTLDTQLTRRRALGVFARLGAGSLLVVGSLIGLSTPAYALVPFMCCRMCYDPYGQSSAGCVCSWCWACCNDESNRYVTYCCECKTASGSTCPTSTCSPEVVKSWVYQDGTTC
jgi:hypothetical protein